MATTRPHTPQLRQRGTLDAQPLEEVIGAEIVDVDLREPLDDDRRDAIGDALVAHQVLVFRGQELDPQQQAAFTRRFGELESHVIRTRDGGRTPLVHVVSNLDANGRPTLTPHSRGNYYWHTDKSYHAVPSLATLLHAKTLPPEGGDTQFACTYLGYEALPPDRREALQGLRVVHSWEASRINSGNRPATGEEKRERPPVEHPLVRTHPVTGRKLLYLGIHTSHVVGLPREEGRALLDDLLALCTRDEFTYTHRWREGDLVMWDNRCVLHRARENYDMGRWPRLLHRTVIRGTPPH